MTSEAVEVADPGLFGPGSITWRVHADPSTAIGGIRSLFLQTLHPKAMAGVAQHSNFREDPWGRLMRTGEYLGTLTFGTTDEAMRAAAKVRGIHRRVTGTEPESGEPYRASDPELLLWVHCTQAESFVMTAVRCGLRLSDAEIDRFYAEQVVAAEVLGVPREQVPDSAAAIADYYTWMRPRLAATAEARRTALFLLYPPMPRWVQVATPARPAMAGVALLAFGLLPPWVRRMYGLPGLPTSDLAAVVSGRVLRRTLVALPQSVREGPQLKAARARLDASG